MKELTSTIQKGLSCCMIGGFLFTAMSMAQGTATYELTFTVTWTADTHPAGFPPNPHFSGMIGGTHNDAVEFWSTGKVASDGIKQMAELGAKGTLRGEINRAVSASNADAIVDAAGLNSPGVRKTTFDIRTPWNLVTVTSMLAPSPDWFVGVSGLNLLDEDMNWIDTLEVDLFVYDAGTDSGANYTSPDEPTNPRENIKRIQESPFLVDGKVKPVGTFRFELQTVKLPSEGYFSVDGTEILGSNGQPIVMKGMGLGGWLLPEGYMLHISVQDYPDGPTGIRNQMIELIGESNTDAFFKLFREKYVQEKDITAIKEWGFDHVRLPFHYRLFYNPEMDQWEEDGFDLLDTFLEWCRKHDLAVLLDMHAAPGAQSEGGIADSDGEARLWTEPDKYWPQTIKIWREIARRYNDDPIIMGYDLINEPTVEDRIASSLADLYTQIINAVQPISPNHLFFLEGNWWATSFDDHLRAIPTQKNNVVYTFHHYWKGADQGAIQYLLDYRGEDQVPLYLGETGENSNPWFHALARVAEKNRVGINWWTHKKIETTTSPLSSPFAPGYEAVINYWRGNAPKPSADAATGALLAMAQNLEIDSARVNRGLLAALFDPEFGTKQKPFKKHELPGIVNAADYDIGNQGVAYDDTDYWAVSGSPGGGNSGRNYRNDGVDVEVSTDPDGFGYNVGFTSRFEWIEYTVDIMEDGIYEVDVRGASNTGGARDGADVLFMIDGERVGEIEVGNTGGWQNWVTRQFRTPELKAGSGHVLRVTFADLEVNLNRMTFRKVSPVNTESEQAILETELLATYPNPFTDAVNIAFSISEQMSVSAVLYDVLGRQVYEADNTSYTVGSHEMSLVPDLAPGVYILRLELAGSQGPHTFTRPLVVGGR